MSDDYHLEYFAHIQNYGDTAWVSQGDTVGTALSGARIEGIAIRVVGKDASEYNVYYSAHLQGSGDTAEFKNGDFCGTRGEYRRLEAIFVKDSNMNIVNFL